MYNSKERNKSMANNTNDKEKLKDEFRRRLRKVKDYLPADYKKKVWERLPDASEGRIHSARYERTFDFEILEIFEELAAAEKKKVKK